MEEPLTFCMTAASPRRRWHSWRVSRPAAAGAPRSRGSWCGRAARGAPAPCCWSSPPAGCRSPWRSRPCTNQSSVPAAGWPITAHLASRATSLVELKVTLCAAASCELELELSDQHLPASDAANLTSKRNSLQSSLSFLQSFCPSVQLRMIRSLDILWNAQKYKTKYLRWSFSWQLYFPDSAVGSLISWQKQWF